MSREGFTLREIGRDLSRSWSGIRLVLLRDRDVDLPEMPEPCFMHRPGRLDADLLVIVTAVTDPDPAYGFLDRCLVAAYAGGLEPLLCLTKSDLAAADDLLANYAALDVPAVTTRRDHALDELAERLVDRTSVLIGHSGVGKSTLVNALVPDAARAIGSVSAIGRGRHTSSSAVALPLPAGGWVIDTPGVRSFGLAHATAADVLATFTDLVPYRATGLRW